MKYIKNEREVEFTTILEDKDKATTFRHFKGSLHQIITIAKNSENLEDMVVYTHEDNNEIWARPANMFFSKVDKEKYPDIEQEYRFEKIN